MPRSFDILRLLTLCVVMGLLGGVWFSYLRPASLGGPASYVVVNGPSMQPTLNDGDLAFLQAQPNYYVGDVVAVRVKGSYAIHRIAGFEGATYITRGDNRAADDTWRPTNAEIAGKMVAHLPGAGRLLQGEMVPFLLGPLLGLLATLIVFGGKRNRAAFKLDDLPVPEPAEAPSPLRRRPRMPVLAEKDSTRVA